MSNLKQLESLGRYEDTELAYLKNGDLVVPVSMSNTLNDLIYKEMRRLGMNPDDYTVTETNSNKKRDDDCVLCHVAYGEIIVPQEMPKALIDVIHYEMLQNDINPAEFTLGVNHKINPETGMPEFFGKFLKKAAKIALPIAGFALGGPVGAAIGGGIAGGINGEGLKGIGKGAAISGLGAGAFSALGGAGGFGSLLGGGGTSAAGAGGAGGGFGSSILGGLKGLVGTRAGTPLGGGMQGPTQGSGFLGGLGKLGGLFGGGGSGGAGGKPFNLGSLLQLGGQGLSSVMEKNDIEKMRSIIEQQAGRAEQQFQPYSQAGKLALQNIQAPSLETLQNDPGYKFRLQQGQQALERSLAARGLGGSGAALMAAQEYGQGLADQTYNDYFNRQGQIANLGYGSASGLGNIYVGLADAQNAAIRAQTENRNKLFGGIGSALGGLFG